jgi:uncharacterized SAM-binding protein YcdF (DUF218 family)
VWFINEIPMQTPEALPAKDVIVVLTGGAGRLERGMELLAAGKGKTLFISGVSKKTTLADLMHYAPPSIHNQLEHLPIILGHEAENTIGNARETATWLRKEKYKDIYLVTSNYHMPRSLTEMREVAPELTFTPVPVFPEDFTIHGWWSDRQSRNLILLEYHKFLAGKFRHWFVSVFRSNT